jgi:hypothetical protein
MGHQRRTKKRRSARKKTHQLKDGTINNGSNEVTHPKDTLKISKKQQKKLPPKKAISSRLFPILSPTGKFGTGVMVLLALVTAYYTFSFKLSITPSTPLDPLDPFSTPFSLRNDSLLWINFINPYKCELKHVETDRYVKFSNLGTELIAPKIPQLESGEPTTFTLPFNKVIGNAGRITYADIEIDVSYYPAFSPSFKFLEKHYKKRFSTYHTKNDTLQWEHKAKSE